LKEELRYYFHEYQEYVAEQIVILRDVETKKCYYFPYTTRFDGNYANRVRAKLRHVKFDFGVLVTLTVDPKRFDNLQKTFDNKGAAIIDGNAWCYWITNSNFYSVSHDLRERMLSTMEQAYNLIREEMCLYDDVVALVERSLYEYVGTIESSLLGSPWPDFVTDQWLYETSFLYSDVHECWFYAGMGDIN